MFDRSIGPLVGQKTAKPLEKSFGIRTVRDLLWHFPRRYSNRGDLTPLVGLPVGEHVTVLAQVLDVQQRQMRKRGGSLLEARITDGVGHLSLTFFNQSWRARDLQKGRRGIFAGKVSEYRGALQLQHPDYQLFPDHSGAAELAPGELVSAEQSMQLDEAAARAFADTPVPIYPATSQIASWAIQSAVELVLDALDPVRDPLPEDIRRAAGVYALGPALELIHRPERNQDWQQARDSMRFREAFDLQIALLDRKRRATIAPSTPRPAVDGGLVSRFDALLPFELTRDQRIVATTLSEELAMPHPMHRLLQGEVGSGKTVVALRAMLQVAEHGGQSALLAPTEVLAAQHFRSIVDALGPQLAPDLVPVLLTGRMPAAERRRALLSVASGNARIVVGTHALLGEDVTFYDLGFIVVDEQHRFGVEQRDTLRRKGAQPHVLTMTATPIPRTVALTAFGDLEVSTIRQLPPGRQGIQTVVVPITEMPRRVARVWERASEELAKGRQIYVVCPAIAPGNGGVGEGTAEGGPESTGPVASVEETLAGLRARSEFSGVRIESLTGAMKTDDKDRLMQDFARGDIGILVSTTVIEVGVNVPNASMMIIQDAERFGVSQLHQLRGRVGRGEHPGLCLLMTRAAQGTPARDRLEAVEEHSDGFVLAERDLQLRREGDILGTAQSGGKSTLKLLRVVEHGELIEHARELASGLLSDDPELESAAGLRETLALEEERGRLRNLSKS